MEEQQIIETVTDVAEAVVPEVVETAQIVKNNPVLLAGVAIVSLAAGAAGGYLVAKRILTTKYDAMLEEEIAQAKDFYAALNKQGDYATPEAAMKKLHSEDGLTEDAQQELLRAADALRAYRGESVKVEETEAGVTVTQTSETVEQEDGSEKTEETTVTNIFLNGQPLDENFDYEAEVAKRREGAPYVITQEEFFENEVDFNQISCTYYEGDDVLADEQDSVIDDVEGNVGETNLKRFGHGSKDRHIVYVRNNLRGNDYEIARSRGKYTKEVLGMDDEDTVPQRRFRPGGDE